MNQNELLTRLQESIKELRTRHTESIRKLTQLQTEIGMISSKITEYEETAKALSTIENFLQKEKL